jgi:hypothetical protein
VTKLNVAAAFNSIHLIVQVVLTAKYFYLITTLVESTNQIFILVDFLFDSVAVWSHHSITLATPKAYSLRLLSRLVTHLVRWLHFMTVVAIIAAG